MTGSSPVETDVLAPRVAAATLASLPFWPIALVFIWVIATDFVASGAVPGAVPGVTLGVTLAPPGPAPSGAADDLTRSCKLMRPVSLMSTRAKKSDSAVSATDTLVAMPGAMAKSTPRRLKAFQLSNSSLIFRSPVPVCPVSLFSALLARNSSSTESPVTLTTGPLPPLALLAKLTSPLNPTSARSNSMFRASPK